MALRDRRGLEGMPLKLLIVTLLISVSTPIVVSSISSFHARTSAAGAEGCAEHVRETIVATYISGPGNRRIADVDLPDGYGLDIGGDLAHAESISIRVMNGGLVSTVYITEPMVRTAGPGNSVCHVIGRVSLAFTCVCENGTCFVRVVPA